jgi:hypothetical protein
MRLVAYSKRDQNEAWIDPWSAVHATSGLAFGLTDVSFFASITAAIIFDVFEHLFERGKYGQRFFNTSGPESWGNVAADLLLFAGGWYLGNRYNSSGPARNPRRSRPPRPRANPATVNARGARQRAGASHVSQHDAMHGSIET